MLLCVRCFFSSSFVFNPVACHLFHSALPLRGVRRVFIQGSPLIKSQSNDGYHRYIHTYVSVLNTVRVFYYTIFNLIVNLYRRIAARYPHHWREQKRNKHIFTYCWNKCTQVSSMCWAAQVLVYMRLLSLVAPLLNRRRCKSLCEINDFCRMNNCATER